LLYWHQSQWWLPLTLRRRDLPDHGGQISLPGGALEPGETSCQAAVREFCEELGVENFQPRILGQLSTIYIERSGFRVDPWVAVTNSRPSMCPSSSEVEELLEVPLAHLLDPAHFGSHRREYRGQPYEAPHFSFGPHRIWGATCLILGEFVTLIEEFLQMGDE
jgi:8-oxo-dGTP pyrophosphatase MutT (NUDIX family)